MKIILLLFLSFLLNNLTHAQYYEELNSTFQSDSFYIKDLDLKLENAIHANPNKLWYLQDLQNKYYKMEKCKSINLKLNTTSLVKNASTEMYDNRKRAVWVVSKLFNSKYDSAKITVPVATAYSINASGICVSNFHVFAEIFSPIRSRMTGKLQTDSSIYFLQNIDGKIYFIDSILAVDPINDITIFHINTNEEKMAFIPIATSSNIGEPVYIISHPDNNFYYLSDGIINRKYRYQVNYKLEGPFFKYVMDVSADYAIGSSGGPIMNKRGELVGMVSSTNIIESYYGTKHQQQMVLKKSVPLEVLRRLIF